MPGVEKEQSVDENQSAAEALEKMIAGESDSSPEKESESKDLPPNPESDSKPVLKDGPIEVIAIRKGNFDRERKMPGDKFFVKSFKQLGSWMECVDKVLEKKHIKAQNDKKLKQRSAGK